MYKTILIGGEAGGGIAKTTELLGKTFARAGYYVFNYREYSSLITGGHNFNILKISDTPIFSHENKFDIIIALNQETIGRHEKSLKKDGVIIGDANLKSLKLKGIDIASELSKLGLPHVMGNNLFLGFLLKIIGLSIKPALEVVKKEFTKHIEEIKKTIIRGYEMAQSGFEFPKSDHKPKYFLSGNEAVSVGAIAAGLDIYLAYPITPATNVLHILAKKQREHNFLVLQPENEIAVMNAALGASFAGAMTMVGTSGPGFALMTEAISLAGIAELPVVIYYSQRTGPSTGVPTFTSQGDLKFAINGAHGEFPRVVLAPGDAKEAYYRIIEAFYLAYKYRVPVIIMADKHLSESNYGFANFEESKITPQRNILENPAQNYKSYLITENGISPIAVPGQGVAARATSYEHDEEGFTIENPEMVKKMNDKRFAKLAFLEKEIAKLNPISIYGEGENLIIGWGSTKGAILDALPKLKNFRFMQISYLEPFPAEMVACEIKKSKKVILVENNVTGLLGQIITEKTGMKIENKILKYDSRPFVPEEIIKAV